eukprot:TRINITY_DN15231_c0_g1_i1.p2 TRINITY_DN15231_c0_g1~~TRINITY_DN15231_c0_g1_i1.p2  ORF type:complete len:53 (-),score=1.38 TRINITY_DN15231_c0_g1_i1:10-168(-)
MGVYFRYKGKIRCIEPKRTPFTHGLDGKSDPEVGVCVLSYDAGTLLVVDTLL